MRGPVEAQARAGHGWSAHMLLTSMVWEVEPVCPIVSVTLRDTTHDPAEENVRVRVAEVVERGPSTKLQL